MIVMLLMRPAWVVDDLFQAIDHVFQYVDSDIVQSNKEVERQVEEIYDALISKATIFSLERQITLPTKIKERNAAMMMC
eukprot:5733637-Karenia_brevis.AAC.1